MCPRCGEQTSFAPGPAEGRKRKPAELEQVIQRPREVPPEELAA